MGEQLEFFVYEGELWCKDGNVNTLIDEKSTAFLDKVVTYVIEHYPDAYDALAEVYKASTPNKPFFKYKVARRFLRCNFASLDSTSFDIDDKAMNFERIDCPLRGECKYDGIICSPIFKTTLSAQEIKVGRMWYKGLSKEEMAGVLFIAPETVNNHIRNIYKKLDIHDKAEFVRYADDKKLFR